MMHFLGRCPACGAEDSIQFADDMLRWSMQGVETREIFCQGCKQSWENWPTLSSLSSALSPERRKGRLIPVHIRTGEHEVMLADLCRADDVPARVINGVLYCALGIKFSLVRQLNESGQSLLVGKTFSIVDQNAQTGIYGHDEVRLLVMLHNSREEVSHRQIMDIYVMLLSTLLTMELIVGEDCYGKGAIAKLVREVEPQYDNKVQCLLWLVLKKTEGVEFANQVFDKMGFATPTAETLASLQIAPR